MVDGMTRITPLSIVLGTFTMWLTSADKVQKRAGASGASGTSDGLAQGDAPGRWDEFACGRAFVHAGGVTDIRATRRRGAELERAILDAAWDVLDEHGWAGFTVERVAAASGTGKAAIYRRWPSRVDIAVDLLRTLSPERTPAVPARGDLRSELLAFLRTGARFLEGPFGQAVRGVLSDSEPRQRLGRDSTLLAPAVRDVEALIDRALVRGELTHRPSDAALNSGQALLTQEFLFCGTVGNEALEAIVDNVWMPALQENPSQPLRPN
jgi:AcrR family transcriptional regulator